MNLLNKNILTLFRHLHSVSVVEVMSPIITTLAYLLGETRVDALNLQTGLSVCSLIVGPPSEKRNIFYEKLAKFLLQLETSFNRTKSTRKFFTTFDVTDFCFPFTELAAKQIFSKYHFGHKVFSDYVVLI